MQTTRNDSALELWLRSRFATYGSLENLVLRAHSPLTTRRLLILMIGLFTVVVALGLQNHNNPFLILRSLSVLPDHRSSGC